MKKPPNREAFSDEGTRAFDAKARRPLTVILYSWRYSPSVASIIALMVCIRFSASSKTTEAGERFEDFVRNFPDIDETLFLPFFSPHRRSSKSWKDGRQCMKIARPGLPVFCIIVTASDFDKGSK